MSRGSRQVQDMAEFLRKEIHAGVRPIEGLVNSSQSLSPNVLWSRNVHKQQPERSKIFIFSALSLLCQSNSEDNHLKLGEKGVLSQFLSPEIFYSHAMFIGSIHA